MADKKTNIPPVHKPTAATVTPPEKPQHGKKDVAPPCATFNLDAPLRWKGANPQEQRVLQNLQGNILKGHGRDRTWNLFFELGADQLLSKRALREIGNFRVTSAYEQLLATEAFKTEQKDGGTFCAAFLTAEAYTALGLTFTAPDGNSAFAPGMKNPSSVSALADPEVTDWEEPFQKTIHLLIIIADDDVARGSAAVREIEDLLTDSGATLHHTQVGQAIRNTAGNGLEHFGYIDGRSQPLMLVEDIEKESRDAGIAHWDPTFPLSTALVQDELADDPDAFGSFFIFRKLEQNVAGFKCREQDLADQLSLIGEDRERAGAFIVGRFEDGTPITMSSDAKNLKEPHNDFDYKADAAASRCPFHAHIRKTNPRGAGGFELEANERLHLMARRGIPYEDTPRTLHPDGLPEALTHDEFNEKVLPHLPTGDIGLLFMAYNAKLDNQFVFTQQTWANNLNFPNAAAPSGLDGVIGQGPNITGGQAYPKEWDNKPMGTKPFDFSGFVTMKGGEYFFAPSIMFLRNL